MITKQEKPLLLVIGGPTASGKTAFAIALAKKLNTVILNADSRQVYRELRVGTAKPDRQELEAVPHYFIGSHSIFTALNASSYAAEASVLLEGLFKIYPLVILAGGSGLYIDALTNGLDPFPEIQPSIRIELSERYRIEGIEILQALLQEHDPVYFKEVDTGNPQRLIRALEVCLSSGLPYSSFRKNNKQEKPFEILKFCLSPDRALLYEQINSRVERMFDKGLLDEARFWNDYAGLSPLKTVGYSELFDFFKGNVSFETTVELIKQHTRNYAKRQLTWFKRDANYEFLPIANQDYVLKKISEL